MTHPPPSLRRLTNPGGYPMGCRSGVLLVGVALLLACSGTASAEGLSAPEQRRIDALITRIGRLTDAQFVRNGRSYDARTAATFLRHKWDSRRELVNSAETFIEHVASRSSTSGRPYLIRFHDGREVPCGDYLRAELRSLAPSMEDAWKP